MTEGIWPEGIVAARCRALTVETALVACCSRFRTAKLPLGLPPRLPLRLPPGLPLGLPLGLVLAAVAQQLLRLLRRAAEERETSERMLPLLLRRRAVDCRVSCDCRLSSSACVHVHVHVHVPCACAM